MQCDDCLYQKDDTCTNEEQNFDLTGECLYFESRELYQRGYQQAIEDVTKCKDSLCHSCKQYDRKIYNCPIWCKTIRDTTDEIKLYSYQQGRADMLENIIKKLKPFYECKNNCCEPKDNCWECMFDKLECIEKELKESEETE